MFTVFKLRKILVLDFNNYNFKITNKVTEPHT